MYCTSMWKCYREKMALKFTWYKIIRQTIHWINKQKIISQIYQPVQLKQHIFLVGRFPVPMDLGHPGTLNILNLTHVKAGDALICFMYGVKEYHKKECRGSPAYVNLINTLPSYVMFFFKFKWSLSNPKICVLQGLCLLTLDFCSHIHSRYWSRKGLRR